MIKRIVYVISDIDKSIGLEWTIAALKSRVDLHLILIGKEESPFVNFLVNEGVRYQVITDSDYPGTMAKFIAITRIIFRLKPLVVHCHLWRANLLGLTAAWITSVPNRFYTRHHSIIHYREYPKGRKWDLLCNFLATQVIAVSENTRKVLVDLDKVPARKVVVIHHGFDLSYFVNINLQRVENLRSKYQLNVKGPMIGIIARHLEWKGIQYSIFAFKKLRLEFPSAHLLLANAKGSYSDIIKSYLVELPKGSFTEILFEEDVAALYNTMNVHVHVPVDSACEAFGQTYVEALAAGVPSVFTLSGVAPEFIVHEQNALVVPFQDSEAIYQATKRLLNDSQLRERLIDNGKLSANLFSLEKMTSALERLYAQ